MDVQLVRHRWYVLWLVEVTQSSRTAAKPQARFALGPDGFFGLVLEALRKASTGTLFGAGVVFAAADGLLT